MGSIRLLFPCAFHEYDFSKKNFNKNELINYCYSQKELNPKGLHGRSNDGGWHSPIYNLTEDNVISTILKKGLQKSVFSTFKEKFIANITYWIMINGKNALNIEHTHPNSNLSGVLWISIPKNSGDTRFLHPSYFESYVEIEHYIDDFQYDTNIYNTYEYFPVEGRMVTFPSYIQHSVNTNTSNEDRIAVSYNINLFLE